MEEECYDSGKGFCECGAPLSDPLETHPDYCEKRSGSGEAAEELKKESKTDEKFLEELKARAHSCGIPLDETEF